MRAIVSLRGVTRAFPGGVAALRNVSLEIGRGELIAIVGPSGSGKSTMLNIIGTLDRASAGTVEIDGLDVAKLRDSDLSALRARRIGFVFQHFHLSPGVSTLDNVADTGAMRGNMDGAFGHHDLVRADNAGDRQAGILLPLPHLPGQRSRIAQRGQIVG